MPIFMDTNGDVEYYHETAYFGWQKTPEQSLVGISNGYKEAADQLVDYVLASENEKIREQFIFPILFNYRHSIEVLMKLIYMRATGKLCDGKHDLLKIWSAIEKDIINGILKDDEIIRCMKEKNPDVCVPRVSDIPSKKIRNKLKELQGANRSASERRAYDQDDRKADVWRYLMGNRQQLYFGENHWIHYPALKAGVNELYCMLDYLYYIIDRFLSGE